MATKEIEIAISPEGHLSIDQIGFEGKECAGAIDALIKALGKEVSKTHNKDWYKKQKVQLNQQLRN
jgi:hypothetical protein